MQENRMGDMQSDFHSRYPRTKKKQLSKRDMDVNNMVINTSEIATGSEEPSGFMDTFSACGQLICALFGIPVNLMIILLIITRRHLRRQPRNTIWIGIGVSNIFILFTNLLELIGFYSAEATTLCRIRFFLLGLPVTSFMMINFLSLVDRYASIFHSVWYRRCVTVRWVLAIQFTAFILLLLLMKNHYIFGLIPVKCNVVPPLDRSIYFGFIIFFFNLCLSGQLTVYIMIEKYMVPPSTSADLQNTDRNNDIATAPTRNIQQQNGLNGTLPASTDNNEAIHIVPEEAVRAMSQPVEPGNAIKKNLYFVRIRNKMVSRLELEATRNVILSVGIMILFTLPWIISSILSLICNASVMNKALGEEETEKSLVEQCSFYYWANSYSRFIYLIGHCIYHFFCYVSRRKDFCAALGRAHTCRETVCDDRIF